MLAGPELENGTTAVAGTSEASWTGGMQPRAHHKPCIAGARRHGQAQATRNNTGERQIARRKDLGFWSSLQHVWSMLDVTAISNELHATLSREILKGPGRPTVHGQLRYRPAILQHDLAS